MGQGSENRAKVTWVTSWFHMIFQTSNNNNTEEVDIYNLTINIEGSCVTMLYEITHIRTFGFTTAQKKTSNAF